MKLAAGRAWLMDHVFLHGLMGIMHGAFVTGDGGATFNSHLASFRGKNFYFKSLSLDSSISHITDLLGTIPASPPDYLGGASVPLIASSDLSVVFFCLKVTNDRSCSIIPAGTVGDSHSQHIQWMKQRAGCSAPGCCSGTATVHSHSWRLDRSTKSPFLVPW